MLIAVVASTIIDPSDQPVGPKSDNFRRQWLYTDSRNAYADVNDDLRNSEIRNLRSRSDDSVHRSDQPVGPKSDNFRRQWLYTDSRNAYADVNDDLRNSEGRK
ncbi:uncharacterized protein LOC125241935 isoform X2 [Leguminivora glycinivorella]|uniref:uncharacterized protein LOC125241935 isoform X2 n=1 Tax=Leguminivora glycinivorella TaxID=1035111 RepID=UPI00200DDAED|nr:uncharacterized protein LOC125241935 isoform X2 [Leguminivora glycinivorella]